MKNIKLRPYQQDIIKKVFSAWEEGHQNVIMQMPTGAGKTLTFAEIIARKKVPTVIIAHRREIIYQISLAMARQKIWHIIIGPKSLTQDAIYSQIHEFGKSYCSEFFLKDCKDNPVFICSVDSLIRKEKLPWFDNIKLVVTDEGHHVLRNNKWGKALHLFQKAVGLFATATPLRADMKGLGREYDGLADVIIKGPSIKYLIEKGYLSKFKLFSPDSNINMKGVRSTKEGDYSQFALAKVLAKSTIVGDVVTHYLKHAKGKLGITFAANVNEAFKICKAFNELGIKAEVVHSKMDAKQRAKAMDDFKSKKIIQLVNVDILGEGVDVPAVEVISFVRPSLSFSLISQQIGRGLRAVSGKEYCILLDHVNNILGGYGRPDQDREWSLSYRQKRNNSGNIFNIKKCPLCDYVCNMFDENCENCNHKFPWRERKLYHKDGDLEEIDFDSTKKYDINEEKDVIKFNEPGSYSCGDSLYLQIKSPGSRRYIIDFVANRRKIYNSIGSVFDLTLDEARKITEEFKKNYLIKKECQYHEKDIIFFNEGEKYFQENLYLKITEKTSGEKTFAWFFVKKIAGVRIKKSIGRWPELSINEAKLLAKIKIDQLIEDRKMELKEKK